MTMKIAVTGATGFIGRHVLAELSKRDVLVHAVARPGRSELPALRQGYWLHADLSDMAGDAYQALGRPDVLIHLAWEGLPNYRSLHHFETELPRQYAFLKHMVEGGLPSLVAAGTCFEYGMQSGALAETFATRPDNPYGFAKDVLRKQLQFLQRSQPFRFTWARLFYMYGEGQGENSLLSQLRRAVEQGDKSFNMSGGEQLRDFLPVEEVARLLVALALNNANIGTVNICAGEPISVRGLVERWLAEFNWDIRLNLGHFPYPDYEPMAFWGDRRKLDAFLGA